MGFFKKKEREKTEHKITAGPHVFSVERYKGLAFDLQEIVNQFFQWVISDGAWQDSYGFTIYTPWQNVQYDIIEELNATYKKGC